ncbi:MAG: ATP-binding protein [Trebonia sp.]
MEDGLRMVRVRACGAWVLPGDPTCAGVARRLFRRVANELALDRETIDDGVTMVSELAANTLHASQRQPLPVNPELWLYLRGTGQGMELVCKVFDTLPGWARGNVPSHTVCRAPADAMSGRGLEVVHELSNGCWGHHLTRSRLSGTGVRGKAVWFALPAVAAGAMADAVAGGNHPITAGDAMTELENDLSTRGFGGRLVRADDHTADMAVLSIASGLTVWCRSAAAWLRAPGVPPQQWSYCDLVEVGEQAVQANEMLITAPAEGSLAEKQPSVPPDCHAARA